MARHYHVDIAVFAADADRKWVDNLLSHFDVPGVEAARQGVARKLSDSGVYHVALVRLLSRDMGIPVERALDLATTLLAGSGVVAVTDALSLRLELAPFHRRIDARIADAVDSIVPARRGRPPAGARRRS